MTLGLVRVRVRVRVMVKVRVKVRFRVQKYLFFDPWRHSEPFIWETYLRFWQGIFCSYKQQNWFYFYPINAKIKKQVNANWMKVSVNLEPILMIRDGISAIFVSLCQNVNKGLICLINFSFFVGSTYKITDISSSWVSRGSYRWPTLVGATNWI